jgi:hypothetical protein
LITRPEPILLTLFSFKWLNRRGGKRRSFTWAVFNRAIKRLGIAKPRITEKPFAQRVFA